MKTKEEHLAAHDNHTTVTGLWISPRDLDASGSAKELPVYSGTLNDKGVRSVQALDRVGMASASIGRVYYQDKKYLAVNLNDGPWRRDQITYLSLQEITD